MKLPNLKLNIGKAADWQNGVFIALLSTIGIFVICLLYLFFKPLDKTVKTIIDEEISKTNITFDKKTIELLRTRQNPNLPAPSSTGKNPFSPF